MSSPVGGAKAAARKRAQLIRAVGQKRKSSS
jgi:hypothetical protein